MLNDKFEIGDRVQIRLKSTYLCNTPFGRSRSGTVTAVHYPIDRGNHRVHVEHDFTESELKEQIWHVSHVERENLLESLANTASRP